MTDFQKNIREQYFSPISFPVSHADLSKDADDFISFLSLPRAVKRSLHFSSKRHRETADGFNEKTGDDGKDPKEFFHYNRRLENHDVYRNVRDTYPEAKRFFETAERLFQQTEQVFGDLLKTELPEHYEYIFDEHGHASDSVLRFLSYKPKTDGGDVLPMSARPHFDKGYFTLALAESAPGLRLGCCGEHPLADVEHQDGTALFMNAWKFFEQSGSVYKPAWHDVIHNPDEPAVNEHCDRWAIVFFANSPKLNFSSWDSVHTPLH